MDLYGHADWHVRHLTGAFTGCLYAERWTSPRDDVRAVVRMNEYGVRISATSLCLYSGDILARYDGVRTPELGRFLADFERPKARVFADRVAENVPDWYLAYSTARIAAEVNYHLPLLAYDQFMLRALVLHEPPEKLERYIDVPWVERGDLYYIHKLAETIKAYRGVRWEKY